MDQPNQPRTKLVDPQGMIARVRAKLNPRCAVALSPYRDVVIAMRLQGVHFREIEAWLIKQGPQHRISASTIFRNLAETQMKVKLTYAEEMLENLGGQVEVNLIREMSQNIWTQKNRLDHLVRHEAARQREPGREGYADKRIHQELAVYNDLLRSLHTLLQEAPLKAKEAEEAEQKRLAAQGVNLTEDATAVLRDLILNNEITLGIPDARPTNQTKH